MSATYYGLENVGFKHLSVKGNSKKPVSDIRKAKQTLWLGRAFHAVDDHEFCFTVLSLSKGEVEAAGLTVAMEVAAQKWVDANPDGDPGTDG